MPDTVRYGIIGTGMMGCEHIRNLELVPGAEVVAIADPDERSRGFGRLTLGRDVGMYADYRELLANAGVDAVVISSPNFTHAEVLEHVFASSKHVLVEKPLCTRVEDLPRVVEAADRHAGVVWVGMEYRYIPPVRRLIEEVQGGAIGRLWMVAIREHRFPFLPKVADWNRFNRNTGGTFVEKCCHFFDLMNLLTCTRPTRVYASGAQNVNHLDERYNGETPDIRDNGFVIVDYQGGERALLDLCMFAEGSTNEMELSATGDRGKLEAFVPEQRLVINRRDRREPATVSFHVDARARRAGTHHGSTLSEHLAFLDAIRTGGKPAVSVADGALAVAVGAAAELSCERREPVELAELGF